MITKLTENEYLIARIWPVFQAVCDVSAFKTRSMHIYAPKTMQFFAPTNENHAHETVVSLWLDEYAKVQISLFFFIFTYIPFLSY